MVKEFWVMNDNKIEQKVIQILPNSLGMVYTQPIKFTKRSSRLASTIKVNGESLKEFLLAKDFGFVLIKINGHKIDPENSDIYIKALHENNWNKITYYVRDNIRSHNRK